MVDVIISFEFEFRTPHTPLQAHTRNIEFQILVCYTIFCNNIIYKGDGKMKRFENSFKTLTALVLALTMFLALPMNVSAATTVEVTPVLKKTLVLDVQNCIQNFEFVNDKYTLATQSTKDDVESRLLLLVKNDAGEYVQQAKVILPENVHPESLAINQNTSTLYISDRYNDSPAITRYTYAIKQTTNGYTLSLSNPKTIYGFEKTTYSNSTTKTYLNSNLNDPNTCKVTRVTVATDPINNQIAFRIQLTSGYGCYYSIYDLSKIETLLNGSATYYNLSDKTTTENHLSTIKSSIRPNNCYQAFDIYKNDSKYYLYVSGGAIGDVGGVVRIEYQNSETTISCNDNTASYCKFYNTIFDGKPEMEGIRRDAYGLYINYNSWISTNPNKLGVYKISE